MPDTRVSSTPIALNNAKRASTLNSKKAVDRQLRRSFCRRGSDLSGPVCDIGAVPLTLHAIFWNRGVNVFGLDLSAGIAYEAKRTDPTSISFRAPCLRWVWL